MAEPEVNHNQAGSDSEGGHGRRLKSKKLGPRQLSMSLVRFVNRTTRKVDVVWLNYEGMGVKYRTLNPGEGVDVNTFVGHPWIFRDNITGEKLVVQANEVFEPEAWAQNGNGNTWPLQRKHVAITIPVYSLKDRCLQEVRKRVHRCDMHRLEIPLTLIKKLLLQEHRGTPSIPPGQSNHNKAQ